ATTRRSGWSSNSSDSPRRIAGWSSTTSTRIGAAVASVATSLRGLRSACSLAVLIVPPGHPRSGDDLRMPVGGPPRNGYAPPSWVWQAPQRASSTTPVPAGSRVPAYLRDQGLAGATRSGRRQRSDHLPPPRL